MAALTFDDIEDKPKSGALTFDDLPDSAQPDMVRSAYQGTMNTVAKPINDAVSAGIGYVGSQLGKMVTPAGKEAFGKAVDYVKTSPVGVAVGEGVQQVKDEANDLAQYNPNLKADLSAFGQNAQLAGNLPILKPIASGVATVASKTLPAKTISNVVKSGVSDTSQLADVATHFYDTAEKTGGLLKSEAVQNAASTIKAKVLKSTPEGQIFGGNTIVDDYLTRLDKISTMPISLKGLDEIDTSLQGAIGAAARAGDKTAVSGLKEIQNGLRNASSTARAQDIVNPQAFEAWRTGDAVYAAKMKSQQIDDIVKNAYNQKVPSTGIQTGFRQLAKSIDKYGKQGWTDDEILAIRKAAKTGVVTGALSTLGGRLISGITGGIAGAVGGGIMGAPIGAAAGEAIGYPMRATANTLQRAKATQVQRLIGGRPVVSKAMDRAAAEAEFLARKAKK